MSGSRVVTVVVLALIVALLVATAIVAVVVRRRRQKLAAPTTLPVVLVHGLFGFDRFGGLDYFRGIEKHLNALGCHAHAVRLPPYASIPDRAKRLVELIEALPHDRVDIIAHSLGGLDARYALAHLGLDKRVRSLVTIGTPHHGSQIADVTGPIAKLFKFEAVGWLSTASLAKFNRDVPDAPNVRYACVVGRAGRSLPLPLVAAHAYLARVGGINDGLVCVSSQYWGEVMAEIEADHLAQIGWRTTFDALGLYAFIVAQLHRPKPKASTKLLG
jgi:triacylglycerol lipase